MLQEFLIKINTVDYDRRNDILYILFSSDRGNSYSEELTDGIDEMKDMITEVPTGITIYYPLRFQERRQKELDEIGLNINLASLCQ